VCPAWVRPKDRAKRPTPRGWLVNCHQRTAPTLAATPMTSRTLLTFRLSRSRPIWAPSQYGQHEATIVGNALTTVCFRPRRFTIARSAHRPQTPAHPFLHGAALNLIRPGGPARLLRWQGPLLLQRFPFDSLEFSFGDLVFLKERLSVFCVQAFSIFRVTRKSSLPVICPKLVNRNFGSIRGVSLLGLTASAIALPLFSPY